jgi:predicted GNAT family acetyltransferase
LNEREIGMTGEVRDNAERRRYELEVDGSLAYAAYEPRGETLVVTRTYTPPALRGQGVAGRLVRGLIADVRARGLKVEPVCSYVVDYFARHPDDADVLAR